MKLLDYIQGLRKGKEAHRIEREAMDDPFLSDALEGFDQVKDDHVRHVEELQKSVSARNQALRSHRLRNWSIAACLLTAALGGSYLLWIKAPDMIPADTIMLTQETIRQDSLPPDTLPAIRPTEVKPKTERPVVAMHRTEEKMKTSQPVAEEQTGNLRMLEDHISAPETIAKADIAEAAHAETKVAETKAVAALAFKAPDVAIRGQVTDRESGEPLVGATVIAKGTTQSTVTDMDGRFVLDVKGKELIVNYIGYDPVMLKPDTTNNLLIAMNPDHKALSEVVVVAYGTHKKSTKESSPTRKEMKSPEPGTGWKAFRKYIKENLKRPAEGACKDSKGKVILHFDIDLNGRPANIIVTQSLCPAADQEAIRLVQEGPQWKQGSGKATVEVSF